MRLNPQVAEVGGIEPISRFHEAFQRPVDAAHAAAAVGFETETFLEKVRENRGLQNVGLLALEGENGGVQTGYMDINLSRCAFFVGLSGADRRASGCNTAGYNTGQACPYPGSEPSHRD